MQEPEEDSVTPKSINPCKDGLNNQLPDLVTFLDADPRPTFFAPIDDVFNLPIPFTIIHANAAFHSNECEQSVLDTSTEAIQFRGWCQSVSYWRNVYFYADTEWAAFKIRGNLKCIRALHSSARETTYSPAYVNSHQSDAAETMRNLQDVKMTDQRLASLYKMMEMSDVGTFEYAPEGTLITANESWYRLSLHPRIEEAHSDFSFMDLVYPADASLVLSQWNKLVQGLPVTFEMRWKGRKYIGSLEDDSHSNEEWQWVLSACVPVMDEQGQLISIAGNTIDINAQKRVQHEALQRAEALERARVSERRFSRFASLAPIAIYIMDPEGHMSYCNSRFHELTGNPVGEDCHNLDWKSVLFSNEDHVELDQQWSALLQEKQRTHAHFRLKHTWDLGDGTARQVWVENQAFPELDDGGNVISIFGAMTDISRFKWAEEYQRTRVEEALLAKQKHENFIDMTSHEMRNPLSAVIQCADSTLDSLKVLHCSMQLGLGQDNVNQTQIESEFALCTDSLNTIISCSLHQKRIIDDVLTLSSSQKMDSNLLTIAPIRVEAATAVSDAVHMFQLECEKHLINLTFLEHSSLDEEGARHVFLDPSRLVQILINLITNAIKFTRDRPQRNIKITLGASSNRPAMDRFRNIHYANVTTDSGNLFETSEWGSGRRVHIWIECQDTGCGLAEDEQNRLFTRFTQATPRTHIRYGGSGLGLFISKKLSELQGGAIGVKSQPGVGSTFAFFVTALIAPPPSPVVAMGQSPLSQAGYIGEDEKQTETQAAVLVVEDNVVNQKVLTQQLRKAGCCVYVSNHGLEALEFLRSTVFWSDCTTSAPVYLSVILMDMEMPVMDGLTCTRTIRELERSGKIKTHLPIISVSANARTEQIAQARGAGCDDTISKPFRISELMLKIQSLAHVEEPPRYP